MQFRSPVKARKVYTCKKCKKNINVGDLYYRQKDSFGTYFQKTKEEELDKFHKECFDI